MAGAGKGTSLGNQQPIDGNGMMVESAPASALKMTQAYSLFEFLIVRSMRHRSFAATNNSSSETAASRLKSQYFVGSGEPSPEPPALYGVPPAID
jgi:hypothetical protein